MNYSKTFPAVLGFYWVIAPAPGRRECVAELTLCDAADKMPTGARKLRFTGGGEAFNFNGYLFAGPIPRPHPDDAKSLGDDVVVLKKAIARAIAVLESAACGITADEKSQKNS